jgi:alkylhydroperoxidase/carboxymuconolactone decarboxylase family protein YurZ
MQFIDAVKTDYASMPISDKMKALLAIAGSVQQGGKSVTQMQIAKAKACGATDKELHDTVLIAALFCLCNRYVDGLGTSAIEDRNYYIERGKMRAEEGYRDFDLNK